MISEPKTTCRPSKKFSPTMTTVVPPVTGPSLGQIAFMIGVASTDTPGAPLPSSPSLRRVRRPCLELLCTNMLSETASRWPSTLICCDMTTWKRRMSRGLPAFFRQFWLHFRKNLRKNLQNHKNQISFCCCCCCDVVETL